MRGLGKKLYSFYIRVVNLLTTKHRFIGNKVPLYRHQSAAFSLTKYIFVGIKAYLYH